MRIYIRFWPWTKFDRLEAALFRARADVKWVENERDHYKKMLEIANRKQA